MLAKRTSYPLDQSPLYRLRRHSRLAALLEISPAELRRLRHSENAYKEFEIPKKNGGTRRVENPARPLKLAQARLARLLGRVTPPDYLFCPVKGRSYVSNAARHRHNRVVRCLDVRKYFPNTPARRIHWFFRTVMHCEADIADTLTRIATYQGHLPTGSPLSPILSHFSYYDIWQSVAQIAASNGLTLTVYIDDVTVSGKNVTLAVLWQIKGVIHSAGLKYHKEKSYIDRPAEVTGVIIRAGRLHAPNRQLKKLHVAKREIAVSKATRKQALLNRIRGLSAQMKQIRDLDRV